MQRLVEYVCVYVGMAEWSAAAACLG